MAGRTSYDGIWRLWNIRRKKEYIMKTYEENMVIWENVLEGITHPMHKYILNEFHSDLTQEIVFMIEEGHVEKDFNSIMNYVLKYLLTHLQVQIKNTTQYELLEKIVGDAIGNEVENSFLKIDSIDIYYIIDDFKSEEEVLVEMKEEDSTIGDLGVTMSINLNLNDKQKAIMDLFNVNLSFGRLVEDYLGYNVGTYINGVYWDNFEE